MLSISAEDKIIMDNIVDVAIDNSLENYCPLGADWHYELDCADIRIIFESIVDKITERYDISISDK